MIIDFSYYTWSRLVFVFFPFCVSGRGSGGDGALGGGLVVEDVLINGNGWWLECSKSITGEDRERSPPPPTPQKRSNLF